MHNKVFQTELTCNFVFSLYFYDRYNIKLGSAIGSAFESNPVDISPMKLMNIAKNGKEQRAVASEKHVWLGDKNATSAYIAVIGDGKSGLIALCSTLRHVDRQSKSKQELQGLSESKMKRAFSIVPNMESGSSILNSLLGAMLYYLSNAESLRIMSEICAALPEYPSPSIYSPDPTQGNFDLLAQVFLSSNSSLYQTEERESAWSFLLEKTSLNDEQISALQDGRNNGDVLDLLNTFHEIAQGLGMERGASGVISPTIMHPVEGASHFETGHLADDLLLVDVAMMHAFGGQVLQEEFEQMYPGTNSVMLSYSYLTTLISGPSHKGEKQASDTEMVALVANTIVSACEESCVKLDIGGYAEKSEKSGSVDIVLLIDPLSKYAQRIAPMLSFVQNVIQGQLTIVFWPTFGFEDLPIKTYYQYAIPTWPSDHQVSNFAWPAENTARFTSLPATTTLSAQLDTPDAWLVGATVASLDLDNLKLEDLGNALSTLYAEFEIESLIVSGSCVDKTAAEMWNYNEYHPNGLQLMLGTANSPRLVDTMVMSNLGYFQLKARPGIFNLDLVPGCSESMFGIANAAEKPNKITVSSFDGILDYTFTVERKDKEDGGVLECEKRSDEKRKAAVSTEEIPKKDGWLSSLGLLRSNKAKRTGEETLNIFSVASGHLYERFLRIMILSVIKNTESRVKFWFIKNYMSPKFKKILPKMAQKYGFEFELITYKWPDWVVAQTEKQRIIWAYKILFLDVIFPMNLERVIYVDADQVVRSDLMELQEMDIKGRPYAYTPFCNK